MVRGGTMGTTRKPRGSSRAARVLRLVPLPAAAQPSKTMATGMRRSKIWPWSVYRRSWSGSRRCLYSSLGTDCRRSTYSSMSAVSVVNGLAPARFNLKASLDGRAELVPILLAAGDAVDPFVQPSAQSLGRGREPVPLQVEVVVAVVIALGIGGMGGIGHVADGADD